MIKIKPVLIRLLVETLVETDLSTKLWKYSDMYIYVVLICLWRRNVQAVHCE